MLNISPSPTYYPFQSMQQFMSMKDRLFRHLDTHKYKYISAQVIISTGGLLGSIAIPLGAAWKITGCVFFASKIVIDVGTLIAASIENSHAQEVELDDINYAHF